MTRLTLDLSDEIDTRLSSIAHQQGISKAEAIRRAFALLSVAYQEADKGNSIGIVREDPDVHKLQAVGRVVGLR